MIIFEVSVLGSPGPPAPDAPVDAVSHSCLGTTSTVASPRNALHPPSPCTTSVPRPDVLCRTLRLPSAPYALSHRLPQAQHWLICDRLLLLPQHPLPDAPPPTLSTLFTPSLPPPPPSGPPHFCEPAHSDRLDLGCACSSMAPGIGNLPPYRASVVS